MTSRASADAHVLNDDAPWGDFDPTAYLARNYRDLLDADAAILSFIRSHFSDHFREHGVDAERPILGIDIGAGANLYPAMAMLPWCRGITLFDRAPKNVSYLREQQLHVDPEWNSFWEVLCKDGEYRRIGTEWTERFRKTVRVQEGNLFSLGRRNLFGRRRFGGRWQIGTMFFVAESISSSHEEFRRAVECFMRILEPGAPFAAAFMEGSTGYDVGNRHFPACDVDEAQVKESFQKFAKKVDTRRLGDVSHMVRPGHTGIILACGKRDPQS